MSRGAGLAALAGMVATLALGWGWVAGGIGLLIAALVFLLTAQEVLVEQEDDRIRRTLREEGWY